MVNFHSYVSLPEGIYKWAIWHRHWIFFGALPGATTFGCLVGGLPRGVPGIPFVAFLGSCDIYGKYIQMYVQYIYIHVYTDLSIYIYIDFHIYI